MNRLIMVARLTRDIDSSKDVHYTTGENSTCITHFSIAVDKRYKNKNNSDAPTADFFNVTCFGKLGEFAKDYLHKGTKIVLEGRLENNNYTDSNGNKVYRDHIVAENIEFAESKKTAEENGTYAAPATADAKGFVNIDDDVNADLPWAK